MVTSEKAGRTWLAKTPQFAGYWGSHPDGAHHAIAQCCDAGANRFGLFVVYRGHESLQCNPINGGLSWEGDESDQPELDGIYTASGCWLGENLDDLAERLRAGTFEPEEYALDRDTVAALKAHKPAD